MNQSSSWLLPQTHPILANDEVHIWLAALDQLRARAPSFLEILAPDERDRAGKFHFEKDRVRYILSRGILRTILARYLQSDAAHLRFDYNAYGKPSLRGGRGVSPSLRFNLSHSHELALYAFTLQREVGLDVEFMRDDFVCEEIAGRFFSEHEVSTLRALPASQRTKGFFNCWTRKEAYVKARGQGLSLPLDSFDVSLAPGEPAALLSVRDGTGEILHWALQELNLTSGYVAAVAVEGVGWQLRCWQWSE
jgi:4'-phosphopantetheinyl transferase